MPQIQLPIFPAGSIAINNQLCIVCDNERVVYFHGLQPVFSHAIDDLSSFRMFTSQLICNGSARISDIVATFGVSPTAVKRSLGKFRAGGSRAFYVKAPTRHGHRLTPEKLLEAQQALYEGLTVPEVSEQVGVLADTLHKAIRSKRLPPARPAKKKS